MVSWQDIRKEVEIAQEKHGAAALDHVRRVAYEDLAKKTGRPVFVYATAFHHPWKASLFGNMMNIDLTDKDGLLELIAKTPGPAVDVFVHSPGGSAEAAESLVAMLRENFEEVRFIITGTAKSAATMLAMSGDEIIMDTAGELGPIDPQILTANGFVPAGSIIEQFDTASQTIEKDPAKLTVWLPILQSMAPALLVQCQNFINLSKSLVESWLKQYMFKGDASLAKNATDIAHYLANEKETLSHARRIDVNQMEKLGAHIVRTSTLPAKTQDAIRKVHLLIMQTLDFTNAIKMFESSTGGVQIRQMNAEPVQIPTQQAIQRIATIRARGQGRTTRVSPDPSGTER